MARAASTKGPTRIQREKTEAILEAALEVFATYGFRGSTLDQIAAQSGISKPNILYYFDGKETIHAELLARLLETWLEPLEHMSDKGDPVEEICAYVARKLAMSRDYPRQSRLFANEVLQGAPRILDELAGPLKALTDEKAALIQGWIDAGLIKAIDPYHLIFSIWSTTQHYADFDVQVRTVLADKADDRFKKAAAFLDTMYRATLTP
ncbi:MAG: TetR family transcriptional regulator C-terminal domain-containing protein [Amylibacter sp.]|nr:TetR family transcriptional regulator C-terminal domain-containing protein [Amylibacter sp.]